MCDVNIELQNIILSLLIKAKQEWQAEKEKILKEAKEKMLKEAKEKLASEIQKTKTETEQKCTKEHTEQIQKLSDEISQTKKKQWVRIQSNIHFNKKEIRCTNEALKKIGPQKHH